MLPRTPDDLDRLLAQPEGPSLECKEAKGGFNDEKLRRYLCALANEGGGHLVLGVTDRRPRRVVGTQAFPHVQADIRRIRESLKPAPRVEAVEIDHPGGRTVVFETGSRARGQVVRHDRVRWVRDGESLTDMDDGRLRQILLEQTDVTAEPCPDAGLDALDPEAVEAFRDGVAAKAREHNPEQAARYAAMSTGQLLRDTRLTGPDGALTRAALLLLGTEDALDRWAPNAEVVFEYRTSPGAARYDQRLPRRRALLLTVAELWEAIRTYASQRPVEVQEGTRVVRLPRFSERAVREAILNAATHRDYFDPEGVLIRMSPDELEVLSPGPFPPTVTPENVAEEQYRRNRKLAEALERCGQIERSGQGVDLMIEMAVRMAQPLPAFEEPQGRRVLVTLSGSPDPAALPVMRRVPTETWPELTAAELRALDAVRRGLARTAIDDGAALRLVERGLIEPGGPGAAAFSFATPLRSSTGEAPLPAVARVVLRLESAGAAGMSLRELDAALADVATAEIQRALRWLRRNGSAYTTGRTKGTRWHLSGR